MVSRVLVVVQTRGGHQGNNLRTNHKFIRRCGFYGKIGKYMKRSRTRQPNIQTCELCEDYEVHQVATMKVDHKILPKHVTMITQEVINVMIQEILCNTFTISVDPN